MSDFTQMMEMAEASRNASRKRGEKPRSIQTCNFRSAGRLSNENARALNEIYETFTRYLANTLDAYLGIDLEVKLKSLDQLPTREHIAQIPQLSYIVPMSLSTAPATMIIEFDIDILYPIIEVLLGGSGLSTHDARDLSEIEEEIAHDVVSLVARQAEQAWRFPQMSLSVGRRIKPSLLTQYCPPNEKVTIAKLELDIAGRSGTFNMVFPGAFVNLLLNQIKEDRPQKKSSVRFFPTPSIRERILDCDFTVTACLPTMKVAVRDLVALQPGSVLKLRAPVKSAGMLTIEGQETFEATPVRNGTQKAAQLGRKIQRTT